MATPYVDIPGFDPRTPEQRFAAHDASIRREVVADVVKDLETYLPEFSGIQAGVYLKILARVRRHTEKVTS